jgi:transaldolase/glucose-6-phosphate isomerase
MDTVTNPAGTTNPLKTLHDFGQSPWLDYIRRGFLADGSLTTLVQRDGLRGMTSNPSIFEKAMTGDEYDTQFKELAAGGARDTSAIYDAMAVDDIQHAADLLRPVYDATKGEDGFVSLEVSPYLARTTEATLDEARRLWGEVNRPNLMVKVPGTPEGVPAIRTLISEGININVTLLFALDAYQAVAEAYVAGLEKRLAAGQDISHLASVASFFVSRIDTAIDKKIDARVAANDKDAAALKAVRGKVAIANAKLAYAWYQDFIASPRWQTLKAAGARPQRLLWASTGTKDKAYSDILYVEELIGPDTVNTMPPATMDAFRQHGKPRASLTEDVEGARHVLAETERLGLDLNAVTTELTADGVRLFATAFDDLLGAVSRKRVELLGSVLSGLKFSLPAELDKAVQDSLEKWRADGAVRRLWAHDASLWTGEDEAKWLGWLDIVDERLENIQELLDFQGDVKQAGFTDVLLLGMGGSSLGPEVLGRTFGHREGWPKLHVLDSTDPQQIQTFENAVDLAKTLCIVSSKSGGTLEPNILKAYFFDRMSKAVGADKAGRHFVAVTDPGSHMQKVAEGDKFRRIFFGDPTIGGRFSVLSNFGLVPAAAIGVDVREFLLSTQRMVRSCTSAVPPLQNPGVQLGTVLGVAGLHGHDKVTIVASPGIGDLGAWLEQLIAESTGKIGRGLIPIDGEALGPDSVYGKDRVFAYLRLNDAPDAAQDAAIAALEKAGQPVIRASLNGHMEIGQQFFVWEFAIATAGSLLGINAFNQPDVEASKIKTRELTDAFNKSGKLPPESPFASFDGFKLFADPANAKALSGNSLTEVLHAHFARIQPGDYAALLAYIERNPAHIKELDTLRLLVRDAKHVAVAAEFGPRFLHSTGQAYKGGPNSGVVLQITGDDAKDLAVPGEHYSFSVVKAAQARGDFDVLAERGRRALRVHIVGDVESGFATLIEAARQALK